MENEQEHGGDVDYSEVVAAITAITDVDPTQWIVVSHFDGVNKPQFCTLGELLVEKGLCLSKAPATEAGVVTLHLGPESEDISDYFHEVHEGFVTRDLQERLAAAEKKLIEANGKLKRVKRWLKRNEKQNIASPVAVDALKKILSTTLEGNQHEA